MLKQFLSHKEHHIMIPHCISQQDTTINCVLENLYKLTQICGPKIVWDLRRKDLSQIQDLETGWKVFKGDHLHFNSNVLQQSESIFNRTKQRMQLHFHYRLICCDKFCLSKTLRRLYSSIFILYYYYYYCDFMMIIIFLHWHYAEPWILQQISVYKMLTAAFVEVAICE